MNKTYKVYIHKCPNKKVYIGITGKKPEDRWEKGYGYRSNVFFMRAIKKYGWENIEHIILYENLSKEEACEKEIELIAKYKSNINKYGYNISFGGDMVMNGRHHTKETKEKISNSKKGMIAWNKNKKLSITHINNLKISHLGHKVKDETKNKISKTLKGIKRGPMSEETKEKLSNSLKGRTGHMLGKHMTEETKEKIRQAKLGKHYTEETKRKMSVPIICIETNIIYYGAREAERKTGIYNTSIINVCKEKQKTAGGYHWKYVKEI